MGLFDKFNKDEFLDKAKSTIGNVAQTVKEKADEAKAASEQKKAEKAALEKEMTDKANQSTADIINSILAYENNGSVFNDLSKEQILSFTKEFYDKIVLPASSVQLTRIQMHPFISPKLIERFGKAVPMFDSSETPILHIKADSKQELMLTEKALYFVLNCTANEKYLSKGRIPIEQISEISFVIGEDKELSTVKCDEYELAGFITDKVIREDFIALNEYFDRIKNHNFEITKEQVDQMIRIKIGDKVCSEIQKYMIYDNEQFVYFAWGINSLTAKDYIVCTTSQIIVMDRELFGATSNVKQLYYEDITSASTEQNSNSNDLTVYLLESALTAATKTCDLNLSVAGNNMKINTLYKVEAERVVQVYHEYRKIGKQANQPQVIVQQQAAPNNDVDIVEQIQKLKGLLDAGILTEEEFNTKKTELLAKM